jgi:NitT/TauT family transport system permease protein
VLHLRLPASVPYLIPAVRLGAASAIIGTVVAEVSTGAKGGIGRLIIEYAQSGSSDPAKAFSPIAGAVLMGLATAGVVALVALTLGRFRSNEVTA